MVQTEQDWQKKCKNCTEPSKHIYSFNDREDTNGELEGDCEVRCSNEYCFIKKKYDALDKKREMLKQSVANENEINGVSVTALKSLGLVKRKGMIEMAKALHIDICLYSRYMNFKEAMPKEIYIRALAILEANAE